MKSNLTLIPLVFVMVLLVGCTGGIPQVTRPSVTREPVTPPPVTVEPGGQLTPYDADLMIADFASQNLGLAVQDVRARGAQGKVSLPASVSGELNAAITLAGPAAAGTFAAASGEKGLAEVALGSGQMSGELEVDLADASIGAYSLVIREAAPQDASAALDVLYRMFPLLSQANLEPQESSAGYVFYGVTTGRQIGGGQGGMEITVDTQATVAGVNSQGRNTVAWVAMALGQLSSGINRKPAY
jgi:hypothetical protein